ncbi:MAG: hypothetical protein ABIQ95_14190 [Bdellovibrionia bacterium]
MKYLNNQSSTWFSVIALSVLGLNTGCDVKTAVAPRNDVQVTQSKSFPLRSSTEEPAAAHFVNNRLFLWKEDETPEQMSRVLAIDTWMDDHDLQAGKLNAELAQIEEKLAPLDGAMKKKNLELNTAKNNINRKNSEILKTEKTLLALQESLRDASDRQPPDTSLLEGLKSQMKAAEDKKLTLQQDIIKLDADRSAAEIELAQLRQNPDLIERDKLKAARVADQDLGERQTAEIAGLVEWYDSPPSSVFFSIEQDGNVKASIDNWVLEKGGEPLSFTSTPPEGEKPTIINAKYEELGGVFQFTVLVYVDLEQSQVMEKYSFRVARLKYEAVDGRVYLAGKFIRTRYYSDGSTEVRDGFAKLIDRNN